MGYPMTWRRFINRSHLGNGGYERAPDQHAIGVNLETWGLIKTEEEFIAAVAPAWRNRLRQHDGAWRMLAGDLRRLELDMLDEGAICRQIAHRTGIEADVVAAVLKEFMAI